MDTMNNFLVNIYTYLPYKREYEYRITTYDAHVAIARAFKMFRKEEMIKGKKLDEVCIKIRKI